MAERNRVGLMVLIITVVLFRSVSVVAGLICRVYGRYSCEEGVFIVEVFILELKNSLRCGSGPKHLAGIMMFDRPRIPRGFRLLQSIPMRRLEV
jgi:hypothetical protein